MDLRLKPDTQVIIVTGPTASGKTAIAVDLALQLDTEVVSADSRQIYRQMPVSTAVPTAEERRGVTHHFIETLDPEQYYSAARYAEDARKVIDQLVAERGTAVVCGGSMLYIKALLNGIDDLPTISDNVRQRYSRRLETEGLSVLADELQALDPEYFKDIDPHNPRRVVHALEIIAESGVAYSALRQGIRRPLPYRTQIIIPELPRDILFERINHRVGAMYQAGMEDEARRLYSMRHLNATNTVGLKEWFDFFDAHPDELTAPLPNTTDCPWDATDITRALPYPHTREAVLARIAKNTRVYAKKQLTLLRKYIQADASADLCLR